MITLDQIKQLDFKVRKAIDKINSLKSANNMLQEKLDTYQIRIEELEILIDTFKEDQGEIEHGIIDALNQLDILEDNIIAPEENISLKQDFTEEEKEISEPVQEEIVEIENPEPSEEETEVEVDNLQEEDSDSSDDSNDSEVELDIF